MREFSRTSQTLTKLGVSLVAAIVMTLQPLVAVNIPSVLAAATTVTVCASGCDQTTIADAVTAASAGDTVLVKAGTYTVTTTIVVDKTLAISGESGAQITTSGGSHVFVTTAPNVTISGLTFTKTDSVNQNLINVQGANTTISANTFSGQYVLGDGQVTRALEISSTTGLTVAGNTFTNLRQPAYINDNTVGSITNNYVNQSRGFVIIANTDLTFSGNTWGTNAVDIAIIDNDEDASTPVVNNYSCADVATIRAQNSNANVNHQVSVRHCVTPPAEQMVTVRPSNLQGWMGIDDNGNGGSLNFVNGPATPPLGTGSAQLAVSAANQGYLLFKPLAYAGTKLSDITELTYSTYTVSSSNILAPSVQLNVTPDVNGATAWHGRLVYEPYMNTATVPDGQWHTWNADDGKWWLSKPVDFGGHCAQASPCTFEELITLYPNIGINTGLYGGVGFKAGSGWTNFAGSVDNFHLATATTNDRYDFEQNVALTAPTNLTPTEGTVTSNPSFPMTWNEVAGAAGYQYRTANTMSGTELGAIIYCDGSVPMTDGGCNGAPYNLSPANFSTNAGTVNRGNNGAPEATYYWQVRAVDADGNTGPWSSISNVTVDTTKPSVPTNGQPRDGTYKATNDFYFNWDASTDASAVIYEFQSSGSNSVDGSGSLIGSWNSIVNGTSEQNHLTSPQIHSIGAPDGHYYWQVRAIDAAGNKSAWSTVWDMNIDTQAPATPQHQSPADGFVLNGNDFWFDWSDVAGAVSYEMQNSTDPTLDANGSFQNVMWTGDYQSIQPTQSQARSVGANGTWYWQVRAVDAAGNKSLWTTPWQVTIDMVAPATPTNLVWTTANGEVIASGGVTNEASGAASWSASTSNDVDYYIYRYWNDIAGNQYKIGSEYVAQPIYGINLPGVFNQGEGTHYFSVAAVDRAGNRSAFSAGFAITYDKTAPTVTVNTVPTGADTTPTITGTTSEAGADVTLWVDGLAVATVASDATGEWEWTPSEVLSIGDHVVLAAVTDEAGNTSSTDTSTAQSYWKAFTVQAVSGGGDTNSNGTGSSGTGSQTTSPTTVTATTNVLSAITGSDSDGDAAAEDGTEAATTTGEVLAAEDTTNAAVNRVSDSDNAGADDSVTSGTVLGLQWYWWLIIVLAIAGGWWLIAAARRRSEDK